MASSPSSNNAVAIMPVHDRGTLCNCESPLPVKQRESWKPDNPTRRFFNCARSLVSDNCCRNFRWIDPPLTQHYKDTIWKLRKRIESLVSMNINYEVGKLKRKLLKEKALRESEKEAAVKKFAEMEAEKEMAFEQLREMQVDKEEASKKVVELEGMIRKLKMKVKMMGVFVAMLVFLVAWVVMFMLG